MKHKFEVCQIFFDFFGLVKNQFGKSIKRLQLDNDTKCVNLEFSIFLKDNEVIHELTCMKTPQQNGVAKRKKCHLLEVVRVLIFQMSVLNVYWREVVLLVTYLINRLSTCFLNSISPIKHMLSFFSSSPLMFSLPSHVFVCVSFVHSHNPHRGKLDPKAVKYVFIGYPLNKKDFKCHHLLSHQVFVSMDVTFHEIESFFVSLHFRGRVIYKSSLSSNQYYEQQYQKHEKPTLVSQIQLFELKVSILKNPIDKGNDHVSSILFLNLCILTIFLYNIRVLLRPLMQSKHLHQYRKL
ncbi:hypothetical protein CR513_23367, partial [Mucuna pruriens]